MYLPEQVAVVFEDTPLRLITHISTGSNKNWCGTKTDGTASRHPSRRRGVYKFYRRRSRRLGRAILGQMYNPVYFNYGVAVHGAYNVPIYPASHGCVRIPMHIAKYFPSLVKQRRPGLRVRRRQGAGGLRRAAAAVRPARPERHDHDRGAANDARAAEAGHDAAAHDGAQGTATTPAPATTPWPPTTTVAPATPPTT